MQLNTFYWIFINKNFGLKFSKISIIVEILVTLLPARMPYSTEAWIVHKTGVPKYPPNAEFEQQSEIGECHWLPRKFEVQPYVLIFESEKIMKIPHENFEYKTFCFFGTKFNIKNQKIYMYSSSHVEIIC